MQFRIPNLLQAKRAIGQAIPCKAPPFKQVLIQYTFGRKDIFEPSPLSGEIRAVDGLSYQPCEQAFRQKIVFRITILRREYPLRWAFDDFATICVCCDAQDVMAAIYCSVPSPLSPRTILLKVSDFPSGRRRELGILLVRSIKKESVFPDDNVIIRNF
jgi:hypothetical protein